VGARLNKELVTAGKLFLKAGEFTTLKSRGPRSVENLSLEMLAQQVGFSPYHFARLFRQTTGESPHQFVLRQRLVEATRLLKETDLPLAHVASEVGIPNQSHFTQAFKRRLGITPLVYRQEH